MAFPDCDLWIQKLGGLFDEKLLTVTEIEVNLMRELLEVFCKDRKRKWLSYTVKNTKDVDSTTFTVLLVQAYKDARYYTKNNHAEEEPHIDTASGLVYSLGPPFPLLMLNSQQPENSHKHLIRFLEHRMKRSSQLVSNLYENQNQFRMRLIETQKENDLFRQQLHTYQEELNEERKRVNSLEPKLSLLKSHIRAFQKDVDEKELVLHILGRKLHEKNLALKKLELEKNLIKQRYSSLLVSETEEIAQKMQKQLKIQSELKRHLEVKDEKLRQIRQILNIAPAGSHMGTSKLKRSHSLRDVALGDAALGVDSGSQIEILRQSVEMGN
ncbi:uncharacterized protein LOC126293602 isoform X4 [Schistocerca gregaria]|uniref:uncharacterized protein LOC126293602 isoform X4 n=1 Tax=Schistocerca gregaria TaxID=7010 RepID=UPI00211EF7C1|nr:uncharacterized protein LOC126293602 isoform X4 [Schistocerca gregaria]